MNHNEIVLDLLNRSRSHLNGVTALFAKAGIDLHGTIPSVQQFEALNQYHPEVFEEVIDYLYPEKKDDAKANSTAWAGIVGTSLAAIGSVFTSIGGTNADAEYQQLQYEKALAEQQAAQNKKTLIIVLGLVFGAAVLGVALYFLLASRR